VEPEGSLPWYARKPPWWLVALILVFAVVILMVIHDPNGP
jgi:hypothetical protein